MGFVQQKIIAANSHDKGAVSRWAFIFYAVLALSVFAASNRVEAIPAFAKKHNVPCTLCHTTWPRLNAEGVKYKINAYQMPDSRDGAETGKTSPAFDLHLDTAKANPPISLRISGGLLAFGPKSGPDGDLANIFPCCMNGNTAGLYAAGTVDKDIAYFTSYRMGSANIDQGYVRIANIFGPGYLGVDLGGIRTADSDAVSPNREWFGSANPAFFGTSNAGGRDQGMGLGYSDSGLRIFGNPDFGPFTYDVMAVSGSRLAGQGVNTRGNAYSLMIRLDTRGFAGSFRYWDNKSGELLFKPTSSGVYSHELGQGTGAVDEFAPNRLATDEKTQDYLFTMNYQADRWEVEAVYDMNNFTLGQRVSGANTYSQGQVNRTGFAMAGIYRISPFMNIGARYGLSAVKDYGQTVNGVTTAVPGATASQFELKWEMLPVQNARISLHWSMDMSDQQARKDSSGRGYDLQNKVFLLWDWAI